MLKQTAVRTGLRRGSNLVRPQSAATPLFAKKCYSVVAPERSLRDPFERAPQSWPSTIQKLDDFEVTTLDGGLQVASINVEVPISSVGLFVKAGPRYETGDVKGASHFLKHLAFSRTSSRSPITVCREMEASTASFSTSVSREHVAYNGQLTHQTVGDFVWMLRDIMHPLAWEYIVNDFRPKVEQEVLEANSDPSLSFVESIHREAFRDVGLGNSLYCPDYRVNDITREQIIRYHQQRYKLSNIALVGFGVKHETLVAHAKEFFPADTFAGDKAPLSTASPDDLAAVHIAEPAASKYQGGEVRIPGPQNTRVALAFEGLQLGDKDSFALQTLTSLLGGGVRYTRNGPGSGVRSRLYRNVVASNDFVEAASAFNASYSDSGVWGVYAEAQRNHVPQVAELLAGQLNSVAANIDDSELSRARNQAKAAFLHGLETREALTGFVANHVLASGKAPLSLGQYCQAIDAVSRDDLARVAKKVLSSDLTVVATGDVVGLPKKDTLRSKINA